MKKTAVTFLLLLTVLVIAAPASAQFYPDPVDLGINNEQQQIEEWFWPALIRQILLKRAPERASTQCQLADQAKANAGGPLEPGCCLDPIPESCRRPLEPQEVITIFEQSGILASFVPKPQNADQVFEYLNGGHALLVGFFIAKDKKHAYLVRGISWDEDGRAMLLINDPNVTEPFRAPFNEEAPGWQTVILIP